MSDGSMADVEVRAMEQEMRELSRSKWTTSATDLNSINTGSLLRIADAAEKIAVNYEKLQRDRDYWKGEYERMCRRNFELEKSNAALRGVITRMKRKAQAAS